MASTITLQQTINWATYYVGNRLLAISAGVGEPAMSSANMVIQTILQPPFKWRWNRASRTFLFTSGDTQVSLSDFGFIEKAYVTASSGPSAGKNIEIPEIKTELALDNASGRPTVISPYLDDNSGNITFRFSPGNPDFPSNVTIIYQKKPTVLSATTSIWPIPDEYQYVYNWGFLALMYLFADSVKFGAANQKFISALLGLAEGLSEQQKMVFLGQWDLIIEQAMRSQARTQQGVQSRTI